MYISYYQPSTMGSIAGTAFSPVHRLGISPFRSREVSRTACGVPLPSHCHSYSRQLAVIECHAGRSSSNVSSVNFYQYPQSNKGSNFFERLVQAWCAISDEAKRRIVDNVVGALSDFVEIESEEKVQLNVSADPDLGTVYSVIVPVRRVKPEYQAYSHNLRNMKYGETRTLDVRFEYPEDLE
ncbi:hypothetical protein GOP47_0021952 [Adiantum capillus-veneris]|uniref:Uncharacterized protein n=1 Tax=Adiantum capillus-veneris TaxID=13818 RepID=A0A9D4U926_ADICA|nr:hypothetical protein GOP47_0021952 [Adiantum capillus-veneris]